MNHKIKKSKKEINSNKYNNKIKVNDKIKNEIKNEKIKIKNMMINNNG